MTAPAQAAVRAAALLVIVAVVLGSVAAGAAVAWLGRPGAGAVEIHVVEDAAFRWHPGQPLFVLALGSDERTGLDGARADAIHLIGVNPAAGGATILNIPRDTWVDIPGAGPNRINEAYNIGGAALQAETVARLTGARPAVVVATTFAGLEAMVDELGGVAVHVGERHADRFSGAWFEPGPIRMGGAQALAYSRDRHIAGGDFARSQNQGNLILAGLAELRAERTSAVDVLRYVAVLLRHSRVGGATVADLVRLGRVALAVDPAAVRNVTMPGRGGRAGRRSVVFPAAGAGSLFADFADDAVLQSH